MSQSHSPHIDDAFPGLHSRGYEVKSPDTPDYNCVAFACDDTERWWQPPSHVSGTFWREDAPQTETLRSWVGMFRLQGYVACDGAELEARYEKIAIFSDQDDLPTHATKQLPSGKWASKLGEWEDIEHNDLKGLEGDTYGMVAVIMKRPINLQQKLPLLEPLTPKSGKAQNNQKK